MRLAIVGGGVAGLSASYALRKAVPQVQITVFEKARGLSGRAATRRKNGVCYDHGANYFYSEVPEIRKLIQDLTDDSTDLTIIKKPVYTFESEGVVRPGDLERDKVEKWTFRKGVSELGKLLAATQPTDPALWRVQLETRIASLHQQQDRTWLLTTTTGSSVGPFDAVLLTPPAPQTVDLLASSSFSTGSQSLLCSALRQGIYQTQMTFVLAYSTPALLQWSRDVPFYAAVNTDRQHDIAWVSVENDKEGHVPPESNTVLLIVQMSPAWSSARYEVDDPLAKFAPEVSRKVSQLLGHGDLASPAWCDLQKWKFALPTHPADTETLRKEGAICGLFFAGDYMMERGRVTLAMQSGLTAAEDIQAWLQ